MIDQTAILDAPILIVDDLEVNVKLLARILGSAKYRCVSSTMDPGAVCSLHRRHRYDLIVLDLLMPDMDGFQVMEGLKEIEPDGYLPVLVISAQPGHKLRALKAGARDFISKPFELPEVLARGNRLAPLVAKQPWRAAPLRWQVTATAGPEVLGAAGGPPRPDTAKARRRVCDRSR